MINIVGFGSSLLVATPLVAMPRLVVAYDSDAEPKKSGRAPWKKPKRKYRGMPGREPDPRFRLPSTPKASDYQPR